jgi:ketosteroid isomerase-like protein
MTAGALTAVDRAAIARAREDWLAAVNADDVDGMVALLAIDGLAFPPHESPLLSLESHRAWHQARVAQFKTKISMSSEELHGAGDLAFDRLSYEIQLTPRTGGGANDDQGACVWIWRREPDGAWKVARAIWNSANPIAAAV